MVILDYIFCRFAVALVVAALNRGTDAAPVFEFAALRARGAAYRTGTWGAHHATSRPQAARMGLSSVSKLIPVSSEEDPAVHAGIDLKFAGRRLRRFQQCNAKIVYAACAAALHQVRVQRMDWRFSLFLLAMFGLLIGFSWGTSEDGLCSDPYITKILAEPSKDGALNCFEFWFNRYQTLAAAAVAFLTAVIAVRPALAQLAEMRKQTDQNTFATLRARHTEIMRAREYFFQVTSKAEIINICGAALINLHPSWGLTPEKVEAFRNAEDAFSFLLANLEQAIEPIWTDSISLCNRKRLIEYFYELGIVAGSIRRRLDSPRFNSLAGEEMRRAVDASRGDINSLDMIHGSIVKLGETYFDALSREETRINVIILNLQSRLFS